MRINFCNFNDFRERPELRHLLCTTQPINNKKTHPALVLQVMGMDDGWMKTNPKISWNERKQRGLRQILSTEFTLNILCLLFSCLQHQSNKHPGRTGISHRVRGKSAPNHRRSTSSVPWKDKWTGRGQGVQEWAFQRAEKDYLNIKAQESMSDR